MAAVQYIVDIFNIMTSEKPKPKIKESKYLQGSLKSLIDRKLHEPCTSFLAQLRNNTMNVLKLTSQTSSEMQDIRSLCENNRLTDNIITGQIKIVKTYVDLSGNLVWFFGIIWWPVHQRFIDITQDHYFVIPLCFEDVNINPEQISLVTPDEESPLIFWVPRAQLQSKHAAPSTCAAIRLPNSAFQVLVRDVIHVNDNDNNSHVELIPHQRITNELLGTIMDEEDKNKDDDAVHEENEEADEEQVHIQCVDDAQTCPEGWYRIIEKKLTKSDIDYKRSTLTIPMSSTTMLKKHLRKEHMQPNTVRL